jgi:circadian clock protein KaiC
MSGQKAATGIPGLDIMLGGGFPQGRVILIIGGPGTGKTIFCSQFLYWGAIEQDDKAVYISLDEPKSHYLREMLAFGWDFAELEQADKFVFVDASSLRRIPEEAKVGRLPVGGKELGLVNLIDMITTTVEKLEARRVVLDSISGLIFRFPKVEERRLAVLDIVEALTATGATCLLTSEVSTVGEVRMVQPEEYLSHGVVVLQTLQSGERAIRVIKMRGTKVDTHPRPYEIKETGIEVYATESILQT